MTKKIVKKNNGIISLILTLFCLFFLWGFLFISNRGMNLISDWLLLAALLGLCLFLGLAIILRMPLSRKRKIQIICAQLVIMISISTLFVYLKPAEKNILSISPNKKHVFLVKESNEDHSLYYFNNYYLILARLKEKLPFQNTEEYQTTWLTNEACVLTYRSKNQSLHQYIGTYGGNKAAYHYVTSDLEGVWLSADDDVQFSLDSSTGIKVSVGGKSESFTFEQAVQFGTTSLVLKDKKNDKWSISLSPENEYNQADELIKNSKTKIELLKASIDNPQKITLFFMNGSEF
ncbi:conserved membrane hypothetical protein [Carnobacterium maltaromaticum]|uniref:hypothetical protein n=1 Tax=Carnobacterium maltaromaticum TaxID=2751 RepID=UPI0019F5F716|nr:hypothetical protein [Carnobacterium maltaromaticum]CAD5901913.1 conserved membrane hypothetical protein [Carnobacterium maltaromaticum]